MEWRPIDGFVGDYEVSNTGLVRSRKTGHYRLLKPKLNKFTGYQFVILYDKNKTRSVTIHRLVAEAFLPNPDNLSVVNHKDEDKTNNNVDNLEWCTTLYNNEYSKRKRYKAIDVYSLDGEYLATFASETIAATFLGVSKGMVTMALAGDRHTCAGFILKSKKEVA